MIQKAFFGLVFCMLTWPGLSQKKQPRHVLLFLFENIEILDFAGPMEVFIQAGFVVYTVAPTKTIKAMNRLTITADYTIHDIDIPTPDILVVPGGDGIDDCIANPDIMTWMERKAQVSLLKFSVCSGAFVFAQIHLLDGKKATTFHSLQDQLQARHPKVSVLKGVRFVDQGEVITTAGISAGIDGALYLVSRVEGLRRARSVAINMEYDKWKEGEGYIVQNEQINLIEKTGMFSSDAKIEFSKMFKGEILNLGDLLFAKTNYADAEHCYRHVYENYTLSPLEHDNFALTLQLQNKPAPPTTTQFFDLLRVGKIDDAINLYHYTKKLYPKWLLFRNWAVVMLAQREFADKGQYQRAIDILRFLQSVSPAFESAYYNAAEYHEKLNQSIWALQNYQKAFELNPENLEAKTRIERLIKHNSRF
jgi:putative intracellular protease/amidase